MTFDFAAIPPAFGIPAAALLGLLTGFLISRYLYLRRLSKALAVSSDARHELQERIQRKEAVMDGLRSQFDQALADLQELNERLIATTAEKAAAMEKAAALGEMQTVMADTYSAISARNLEESNQSFMRLADTVLSKYVAAAKADFGQREKAVENTVRPIHDALTRYDQQVQAMERSREKAYGGLSQQVQSLARAQSELNRETGNLVKALRLPQVRGRWGEMTLRRVVELAGMQNRCDFFEQQTITTGTGVQRPDMVVKLPANRQVVVDAKVPLAAYLDALEAGSDAERSGLMATHARQLKDHISKLSQKAYWQQFQSTPEFVVLFIPGESFFSAALSVMTDLIEFGVQRNIIVATPTTLISLLKTVALGWRQEEMAENAHAISELGSELYQRLLSMTSRLEELGRGLDRSVTNYNRLVGSFERRVLASARKFTTLGVSTENGKSMDTPTLLENKPRQMIPTEGEENKNV